jgi:transcriptional regulator with XRE-family HTH domain
MTAFSSNLKFLRRQKRMTQAETAAALGIKRTTLANYETAVSSPDFEKLLRIASYFETTVDNLITKDMTKYIPTNTPPTPPEQPCTLKGIMDMLAEVKTELEEVKRILAAADIV